MLHYILFLIFQHFRNISFFFSIFISLGPQLTKEVDSPNSSSDA